MEAINTIFDTVTCLFQNIMAIIINLNSFSICTLFLTLALRLEFAPVVVNCRLMRLIVVGPRGLFEIHISDGVVGLEFWPGDTQFS